MTIHSKKEIEERFVNVTKSKTFNNIVEAFDLKSKRVLDLGCSYGEYLVHFGKGSVGITIDDEEVVYGKSLGLPVLKGNAEKELPSSGRFEAIYANNLFEHLHSPHLFLANMRNYLVDGGVLILGVPCIPVISPLLGLRKFRGSLAVAHINFFNRLTLKKTVERAGYRVHMVRSFHAKNSIIDSLLNIVSPHFYAIATPKLGFEYHEKRKKELRGYE